MAFYVAGDDILATDVVEVSTGASDAGKGGRLNADGQWDRSMLPLRFGGSGSDGALSISSGTTNIDVGAAQIFIKEYSSLSITGTGKLTFSNPHANGTIVILKVRGDVTLTSSTSPLIDVSAMGAAGGISSNADNNNNSVAGYDGSLGSDTSGIIFSATAAKGGGRNGAAGLAGAGGAVLYNPGAITATALRVIGTSIDLVCGNGGAAGNRRVTSSVSYGAGQSPSSLPASNGGRGGGVLYVECGGALNFTGTINANGENGHDGDDTLSAPNNNAIGGGAGGGGACGQCVILANEITANSGTVNTVAGSGGAGGDAAVATSIGDDSDVSGSGGGGGGRRAAGGIGGLGVSTNANGNAGAAGNLGSGGGGGGGAHNKTSSSTKTGGAGGGTGTPATDSYVGLNRMLS